VTPYEQRELRRQLEGGEYQHVHGGGSYYKQQVTRNSVLVATYLYHDESGRAVAKKVRFAPKAFMWLRKEGEVWLPEKPTEWLLYRLHELIGASVSEPVFVTEGEKDCDKVVSLGSLATSAPGPWSEKYNRYFKGRTVYILQDNDEAGRKRARHTARGLIEVAADVRIIEFPELDEGEDVSDFIEAGGTLEILQARCRAAPSFRELAIQMREGALVEIADKAQEGLLRAKAPIYQRGGELVRPIKVDQVKHDAPIRRAIGSTILTAVREPWLYEQLARHMEWNKVKVQADGTVKVTLSDPYTKYAKAILGRAGEWPFRVLTGILTAPTLDREGRVVEQPGYDIATGMLIDFEVGAFPAVPESPTKDDAAAALALFADPERGILRGFPFASPADLSVALSGFLTTLVRPSLDTAPAHGIDAPVAGSGKSLLVDIIGVVATGSTPPAMAQGKTPEEVEKRLGAVLMAGDSIIWLDNCERPVEGDLLCSMLTQKLIGVRPLGVSERRLLPNTAVVFATGNNLTLAGDVTRRAIICRLDAGHERPDQRVFDFDAKKEAMARRPELVVAALTALRAYKLAGSPIKVTPFGSFPDYDWIRETLVWCGFADPADTRGAILDADPHRGELSEVMGIWSDQLGERFVTVAELGAQMGGSLQAALIAATTGAHWNAKSVGRWLARHKDRVVGGHAFRQGVGHRWKLENT
jgi:hypothetical protein